MKIKHVQQVNDNTCVHASLSMVTGEPIEYYINRFGDIPLGFQEVATALVEKKILPRQCNDPHDFPLVGFYMVTVPSKNFIGLSHQVVVEASTDGYVVYDPQEGREGKNFWTGDDLMSGKMGRMEVLYLDCDVLMHMRDVVR